MKLVFDSPPNITAIRAAFPNISRTNPTFFAYGDTVFAINAKRIPPEIEAHEAVHGERQLAIGVDEWWRRYIASPAFRLEEEVLAHRAEYEFLVRNYPGRAARRRNLALLAGKLSAPLYGGMISKAEAKALIAGPHTVVTGPHAVMEEADGRF